MNKKNSGILNRTHRSATIYNFRRKTTYTYNSREKIPYNGMMNENPDRGIKSKEGVQQK